MQNRSIQCRRYLMHYRIFRGRVAVGRTSESFRACLINRAPDSMGATTEVLRSHFRRYGVDVAVRTPLKTSDFS